MMRTEAIEVVYPNGARALHPTSLQLDPCSFTVLLGPPGAGKTTLLRCLNGLTAPTSGRVVVDGLGDISNRAILRAHRRRTGAIFGPNYLVGRMGALNNVLMGGLGRYSSASLLFSWRPEDRERAVAALDRVGMLKQAWTRAERLSAAEQLRVAVARALVQEPYIVLADDPTAGLDPREATEVMWLLRGICKSDRLAAVVSLRQSHLARRYADRTLGLQAGRIVFDVPFGDIDGDFRSRLFAMN